MSEPIADFSLLGGPLHRFGVRFGLVRRGTNCAPMGALFGVLPWFVLSVMAALEGRGEALFSLEAVSVHVRLLVAIPLFFLCEAGLDPRVTTFVREIVDAGLVSDRELPELQRQIEHSSRRKDGWQTDAGCFAVAIASELFGPKLALTSMMPSLHQNPALWTWSGEWYWLVCIPLFRFLLLRLLCRLWLWCSFLWRLSRLDLRLLPAHPDRTGGLGYLEVVQVYYWPLLLAISAVQSASLAQEVASGVRAIKLPVQEIGVMLGTEALLVLGPLVLFTPRLWACRTQGLSDYAAFASKYVRAFDDKWLRPQLSGSGEPLLGTPDLQSLADLAGSIDVVRSMRWAPIGPRLLVGVACVALMPVLPLVLFKYPLAELVTAFVRQLSGL